MFKMFNFTIIIEISIPKKKKKKKKKIFKKKKKKKKKKKNLLFIWITVLNLIYYNLNFFFPTSTMLTLK